MKDIIIKTVYYCPECNSHYFSQQEAYKCNRSCVLMKGIEKREKNKREKIGNHLRLSIKRYEDVKTTLTKFIKKTYGDDIKFTKFFDCSVNAISNVSCANGAPIGKPTNWSGESHKPTTYLGIKGSIQGTIQSSNRKRQKYRNLSFSNYFDDGFYNYDIKHPIIGFHTGTGGGNGENGITEKNIFYYEFYFFIQDFPHLLNIYKKKIFVESL